MAQTLATDEKTLDKVLQLDTFGLNHALEGPWILKEFLQARAKAEGKEPVSFTALKGSYRDYWFLN